MTIKKEEEKNIPQAILFTNWWNISDEQFDMHYQEGRSTKRS